MDWRARYDQAIGFVVGGVCFCLGIVIVASLLVGFADIVSWIGGIK